MKSIVQIIVFFFGVAAVQAQSNNITGTVTSSKNLPVAKATVHLLNTGRTTITDNSGHFTIDHLTKGNYTLEITSVGYAALNKLISVEDNTSSLQIQLADAGTKLDEVIVTAQKREELAQTMPVSITNISSKQVKEYRLWDSKDITAVVPGLYSSNPGDNRNVTSIRGITTTSYDPAVATYIDGVNQFGLDTYISPLIDVERIEVLRGPQGTLYGRNAMGGVINIVTKQPSDKATGFAEVNIGNHNQQRYTAAYRAPLIKNKLYIGIAGLYNSRNGFYTNEFTNSSYDKQHNFTGNYYLKYIASKSWSFNLNVKHNNARNNGAFPLVFGTDEAFQNPYKLNQNATTTMVDNTFNTSLSVMHTGKGFNFTSQTAYQRNYRFYKQPIDGDFSPIDGISIINNYGKKWNNVKVVTQEFRFTSPAASASRLKWTSGAYFFYQYAPTKQATRYGADANMMGVGDSLFTTLNTTKTYNAGVAVYGDATYSVTNKLSITAGLRYDYAHQKKNVMGEYQHDPEPEYFTTFPDTTGKTSYNALSPKLSVNYKLTQNSFAYITYNRGFRTGGLTDLSSDPSQLPLYAYKPEYSNNYEAGIKNNFFGNKLQFNVAAFYGTINNAQVPTLILPDAVTIIKNTGKLISKGIEAEVLSVPVRNLQVQYNFGYTDAKYDDYKTAQNGETVNLKGKRQVFTPDITSMLALQYDYVIGGKQQLRAIVRGEWSYLGDTYFDLNNTIKQSAYSLVNARAGFATKNYELMFWARNIFDKKYISYAYDFGAVHLGDPATIGVSLSVSIK